MRTLIRWATLALALVASIPVTNAQSPVTQQPYDAFIVQPSGTLIAKMPFVAIPEGVIGPVQTVQTNQLEHAAPPVKTVHTNEPKTGGTAGANSSNRPAGACDTPPTDRVK